MSQPVLQLRKPLERSVRAGHPWVFSEALVTPGRTPGAVATLLDRRGRFLARGLVDAPPIGLRVYTTRDEPLDDGLLARRLDAAIDLRARVVDDDTDAYRLVHGEGDRLPGVVCDRYGRFAVLRLDGAAAEGLQARLVKLLGIRLKRLGVQGLLVRTGRRAGLQVRQAFGPAPDAEIAVHERGMPLQVNLWQGQKTGMFLDHRDSRHRVRELAADLRVLNLYGYTGGFSVAAALGGARHVDTVDIAPEAIATAIRSLQAVGYPAAQQRNLAEDVPEALRRLAAEGRRYDLIVSDPPNFAPNRAAVRNAMGSYGNLHGACLGLLEPGGFYLAASCSSHVDRDSFRSTLEDGARRAGVPLQVLEWSSAPADHPRLLAFPEGDYLKVALCRVPA